MSISLPQQVRMGWAKQHDGMLWSWAVLFEWANGSGYLPLGEDSE
jgi:hypothetical protein